jgi:hypothetical protein
MEFIFLFKFAVRIVNRAYFGEFLAATVPLPPLSLPITITSSPVKAIPPTVNPITISVLSAALENSLTASTHSTDSAADSTSSECCDSSTEISATASSDAVTTCKPVQTTNTEQLAENTAISAGITGPALINTLFF